MTTTTNELVATALQRWRQNATKLEQAGEAIPADKYDWRPAETVRSSAEVLRHVAYWNQYLNAALHGTTGDDSANELSPAEYPAKEQILKALAAGNKAVGEAIEGSGTLKAETLATLIAFLEHNAEHYGQLAVYCRLLGIVPPASRG